MPNKWTQVDWQKFQPWPVIGVDEAGRGCLFGSVFSAAVILSQNNYYPDSKATSAKKRINLAQKIMQECLYAVGTASVEEINKINILQATFLSMKRAILQLPLSTGHVLVDGPYTIPNLPKHFKQTALIKGDQRATPISASSIIAKVKRDEWIIKQDQLYPQYGLSAHKGYATSQHLRALEKYGPCPLHRKKFLRKITKTTPKNKGQICEEIAQQFFQKKGWQLKAKNQKWAGVEIDLIFKNQTHWLLVEVKSNNTWRHTHPMSFEQKKRLSQAFFVFCEQHKEPVEICLAIVNQTKSIQTFPLEVSFN